RSNPLRTNGLSTIAHCGTPPGTPYGPPRGTPLGHAWDTFFTKTVDIASSPSPTITYGCGHPGGRAVDAPWTPCGRSVDGERFGKNKNPAQGSIPQTGNLEP